MKSSTFLFIKGSFRQDFNPFIVSLAIGIDFTVTIIETVRYYIIIIFLNV